MKGEFRLSKLRLIGDVTALSSHFFFVSLMKTIFFWLGLFPLDPRHQSLNFSVKFCFVSIPREINGFVK